jgi:predicted ATPase
MVMDMFYAYVEMKRKKRVHFHGFMLDVHKSKLTIWRKKFFSV